MRANWTVATLIAVLAAGWSGAWVYGRSRVAAEIDPALAQLADRGVTIVCPDHQIGGFPLAMAVGCPFVSVALADGTRLMAERVDVRASVTDWHAITARLKAPLMLTLADGRTVKVLKGDLDIAVRLENQRPVGADVSIAGAAMVAELGGDVPLKLRLGPATGSVRTTGDPATAEVRVSALDPSIGDEPLLPAPTDLSLHLKLANAAAVMAGGDLASWAADGGKLLIDSVEVAIGETTIAATGEATLSPDGLVNAEITTVANHTDKLPGIAKAAGRSLSPAFAGLGVAYMLMGKSADGGGRKIVVDVREGAVRAGGRQIANLPPLF